MVESEQELEYSSLLFLQELFTGNRNNASGIGPPPTDPDERNQRIRPLQLRFRPQCYPLHLANLDQPGAMDVMKRSFRRALETAGPGQRQAMVQAHAGLIGAAPGLGDETLISLQRLQGDLYPNGL